MDAGRELDDIVAERVFGQVKPTLPPSEKMCDANLFADGGESYEGKGVWFASTTGYEHGDEPIWVPRNYSTDIAAAMQALEKVMPELTECKCSCGEDGRWLVTLFINKVYAKKVDVYYCAGPYTLPHAIALAVARFKGAEV